MKYKLLFSFLLVSILFTSCTLLYYIYPGKPKEGSFKHINKTTISTTPSNCYTDSPSFYEDITHINGDPPYINYLIFFDDGRFCMDSYVVDTIGYYEYIKYLYSNYRKAQFYGYYYCNLDTIRVEYVSEVRDGFRNNYYFKEFIAVNDSTLKSSVTIVQAKNRAIKDIGTFYKKRMPQ